MAIRDPKTVYFCVDLEASGPVPGLYNMVSVGGVEVRFDGHKHVRGDTFYYGIVPDFDGFLPSAMKIHGLTEEHLRANGEDAKAVMQKMADFVNTRVGKKERPLFVGHNAPFDWMFVAWYFAWAEMDNPFGYNALDTKALIMGRHQVKWRDCSKSRMLRTYSHLKEPAPEMVHNALADAEFQADILIALLDD